MIKTIYNSIAITASEAQPFTECSSVSLLFDTYTGLKCSYSGDVMTVSWDEPSNWISSGTLMVSNGGSCVYKMPDYLRSMNIEMPIADFGDGVVWSIYAEPQISKVSSGPDSETLTLYAGLPDIVSAGVSESEVTTVVTLPDAVSADAANIMLRFALLLNRQEVYHSDLLALGTATDKKYTVNCAIGKTFAGDFSSYELAVYLCNKTGTVMNCNLTDQNCIFLSVPDVLIERQSGRSASALWDSVKPFCTSTASFWMALFSEIKSPQTATHGLTSVRI